MNVQPASWAIPEVMDGLDADQAEDLLSDLICTFETDTAHRLACLRTAIEGEDRPAMSVQIHSIKGSAAQMGARAMASYCQTIERAIPQATPGQMLRYGNELETLFAAACLEMASVLRRPFGTEP